MISRPRLPKIFSLLMLPTLALGSALTTSAQTATEKLLTPNKEITVSVTTPESHPADEYQFSATSGEYIELQGQQHGCDIRLHIIDATGREIAVTDSYNGPYGPEYWRGLATASGNYRVRVD